VSGGMSRSVQDPEASRDIEYLRVGEFPGDRRRREVTPGSAGEEPTRRRRGTRRARARSHVSGIIRMHVNPVGRRLLDHAGSTARMVEVGVRQDDALDIARMLADGGERRDDALRGAPEPAVDERHRAVVLQEGVGVDEVAQGRDAVDAVGQGDGRWPAHGVSVGSPAMRVVDSVVELIGNTPLVRLHHVAEGITCPVYAKVEYLNPGGSVKDRIATRMIEAAEREGLIGAGGTIVEPTSGNTGVGLAIVAQQRGYKCIFVCPDKVSKDKQDVLRAYGAEVIECPTAVDPEDPRSYYSVSDRLAREIPGAWKPDQYSNPNNPLSHYETTGPEIWEQTDGRVTHFVAGAGTGGTISGVGRYLKEVSDGRVRIIAADPEGSVYSGGTGRPYLVEGVGEDFWPTTYDDTIADEVIAVSDRDSFEMTRRMAREEGLLVGGSCGMAVVAALDVARRASADDMVVVLLPDGGRGYLSKVFNDEWLASYGFGAPVSDRTVGDVLRGKSGDLPPFVHAHPTESVREAIDTLREFGVSQMPVVRAEPPVMAAEVVGSVVERDLLDGLFAGRASLADTLDQHMSAKLPQVGAGEPVSAAVTAMQHSDAILVLDDGKPVGVLSRQDLLGYLAG
jgi:cystathionine beta-synthase